jgi:hypothetical protein
VEYVKKEKTVGKKLFDAWDRIAPAIILTAALTPVFSAIFFNTTTEAKTSTNTPPQEINATAPQNNTAASPYTIEPTLQ